MYFSGGYGGHREMEGFFAWAVTGGTGGLMNCVLCFCDVSSIRHSPEFSLEAGNWENRCLPCQNLPPTLSVFSL